MPFPKNAQIADTHLIIEGPHVSIQDGKWFYSHTDVVARLEVAGIGSVFLICPIDALTDVEVTLQEIEEIEAKTIESWPEAIRLAKAITRQTNAAPDQEET